MDVLVDGLCVPNLIVTVLRRCRSFCLHKILLASQNITCLAFSFARIGLAFLGFHLIFIVRVEVARSVTGAALTTDLAEVYIIGVVAATISTFADQFESLPVAIAFPLLRLHELLAHNFVEVDTIDFFFVRLCDHSVSLLLPIELLQLAQELLRIFDLLIHFLVQI